MIRKFKNNKWVVAIFWSVLALQALSIGALFYCKGKPELKPLAVSAIVVLVITLPEMIAAILMGLVKEDQKKT